MKRTLAAAAIAVLTFTVPTLAETIDLATVKCSELATMDQSGATFMFTWLLGYQNGVNGTTTMDLAAMDSIGTQIGEYCAQNPDVGLLAASTEVMGE
jgi:acid stress chaperone HdeB